MKKLLFIIPLLGLVLTTFSQGKVVEKIKAAVTKDDAEAHLTFLASDEMRGRDTGSPEVAIAANYVAAQLKILGVKTVGGSGTYFQEVALQQVRPPGVVDLKLGNEVFKFKDDLLLLKGKSFASEGDIVFVGYGNEEDFNSTDVKGKMVVAYTGSSETGNARQAFVKDSPQKYKRVKEKGGVALIEIMTFQEMPWQMIAGFLSGTRTSLAGDNPETNDMPHLWMRKSASGALTNLIQQKSARGSLTIDASTPKGISGKNVIGVIEGTDPKLRKEYVILSAHYDHVGVRKNDSPDSIYNGARDNALGTTAILEAAKFFSKNPAKRSILILAFCAEERGLLGSRWYAGHPLVPLAQTVYNLDCDGAGYNDKTIVTLIDLNRTTADELLKKGCEAFGLGLKGDPAPEQNLYERSDNYNFAVKGVPAVDFSPGVKSFDEELIKYYHQPADEVSSLDFDYLEKFLRAYVYSSWLIGNSPARPVWKPGDKFEEAGRRLYGSLYGN